MGAGPSLEECSVGKWATAGAHIVWRVPLECGAYVQVQMGRQGQDGLGSAESPGKLREWHNQAGGAAIAVSAHEVRSREIWGAPPCGRGGLR